MVKKQIPLNFVQAKGLGSYHCFGAAEDKNHKLHRGTVNQYGFLADLSNAEETLAKALPPGFVADAIASGWTLADAIKFAQAQYAGNQTSRGDRVSTDPQAKRLAGILAGLTPDVSPSDLLKELRNLLQDQGEAAVKHLEHYEQRAGRDSGGYIYLRKRK